MKTRVLWISVFLLGMLAAISVVPTQAATTFGRWRDINPTQYITANPAGTLRGVYVYKSGGSAAIGAGDGWVVGGDSGSGNGIIAHYDGFSWSILSPPVAGSTYYSVNFCLNPGAPGVGSLCSPYTRNGYVADGWLVGTVSGTTPVATYWDGGGLTEVDTGLLAALAGNLTSVFMVCNSPETGQLGCSGPFASAGLTYAAGESTTGVGIICNFNGDPKAGGSWACPHLSTIAGNTHYNSVYMFVDQSGALGGFAVGDAGDIARLNGGSWTDSQPAGSGVTFRSVFVDQGGNNLEAWAVGDAGQIWHFCCGSAGSWSGPVSPGATSQNLEGVVLVSSSEGWAVGSSSVILHSTTLGTTNQWLALTSPGQTATASGISLIGVSFPGSGNGWAVGTSGVILDTQNSNCGNAVLSPCWGGNTGILQSGNLTSVFEISQSDAWAGGYWDFASNLPALIHWDGTKWHRAQVAPPAQLAGNPFNITSIYMSGSSDGWAVGGIACPTASGTNPCVTPTEVPFAIHWDGNSWTGSSASQPVCTCALTSVFMINSGEGWAVGDSGEFFHYTSNTNQWGLVQTATGSPKLNSVFISNPGNNPNAGWAVGNGGTVYELSISGGSATWNLVTIPALGAFTPNLYSVFFTDSNHGWIVGAEGTILTTTNGGQGWSGGELQVAGDPNPSGSALKSVYIDNPNTGSGNGDGWAVGGTTETGSTAQAIFAHWDGQIWTATTISPPLALGLALNSVYGQPGNTQDGWAVGAGPTVTPPPVPLAGIFHLDPLNPPVAGQQGQQATITTTVSNTQVSSSSQATTTATTNVAPTSTAATSAVFSSTVTSSFTTTVPSVTVSTVTVSSTPTTTITSATSYISTPMVLPAIPGFPWESIIAGLMLGVAALAILRRIKK